MVQAPGFDVVEITLTVECLEHQDNGNADGLHSSV